MGRFRAVLILATSVAAAATFDVRHFGATGDGVAKDTAAIQKAIDAAEANGGGTVLLPAGQYLSGTLRLKSRVTFHLENGATLAASQDNADFAPYEPLAFRSVSDEETTYFRYGLLTAENVEHIAITGEGIIDGNRTRRHGPKTIAIKLCRHVAIRGVTVQNSPNYSISFWGTDFIDIDGVTVLNGFADGIDPDASRFVRISNCYIDCYDDAICPKASPSMGMENRRGVEHLTVTNCILRTNCNAFKFGTESSGDFRNVTVSNCTMLPREKGRRPISGISLESVDGARIDGVAVSNIVMEGVSAPVFVRLGNRGRGLSPPSPGSIENVSISNLIARGASVTSSITGLPGFPVRRVTLANVRIHVEGGHRGTASLEVPEQAAAYPEATMFGTLPAYALYARHMEGLTLSGIASRWAKEDLRPAMVFDDASEVTVDGPRTEGAAGQGPVLWLNETRGALIRGARPAAGALFMRVSGAGSKGIVITASDLAGVQRAISFEGAPKSAAAVRSR